jgi:hypothetical protein
MFTYFLRIFKGFICYVHLMILSYIVILKQEHIPYLVFSMYVFRPIYLLVVSTGASTFYFKALSMHIDLLT